MSVLTTPPLALYVHLPWCVRKCPYCDFNSHALPAAGLPERAYLSALLADLDASAAELGGREVVSVFFGGGTPSLFSAASIGAVLDRLAERLPVAPDVEVTLEANPGTVEHGTFAGYRAAGVNRVSLGAQSFDDTSLGALGRIHAADETVAAVAEIRAAGIDDFNLDLMYALPDQAVEAALADVARAIDLGPTHLSHYHLTLEPGTAFERRPPRLPDEEAMEAMQVGCHERLAAAGYAQYEVSAYARDGARCRHNLNYWSHGDYLGIGAGAHGKRSDADLQRITRTTRWREPRRYMSTAAQAPALREVEPPERPFEFMMNALRLADGFAPALFEARTGLDWAVIEPTIQRLVVRNLIERSVLKCRPTRRGLAFLNELLLEFMPETRAGAAS